MWEEYVLDYFKNMKADNWMKMMVNYNNWRGVDEKTKTLAAELWGF